MNKKLVVYAVCLVTSLVGAYVRIGPGPVYGAYDPGTGWDDEIFFAHNWSLEFEDTSEYYTVTPGGSPRTIPTGVTVTDCQPAVAPWNASNPWGAGNTTIVRYEYELKLVDLATNGVPACMLYEDNAYTPGAVYLEKYNSTNYRLRIGRFGIDNTIDLSFLVRYNQYYRVRHYAGLNRSSGYYRQYALVYDEYGSLLGNKSGGYGAGGSPQLNGQFDFHILDQNGIESYVRNLRAYAPAGFTPPPSDPLETPYWSEARIQILILIIGLGLVLVPPSYIAYQKPPASTIAVMLFVMIIGLGLLIQVAHYTVT